MRSAYFVLAAGVLVVAAASDARAQNFNGNNASFTPEVSIVESGAKLDVQATVSADRKYVTLTMQPQVATLIALREFTFQNGGGTVGMNNPGNNPNPNAPRATSGGRANGPLMPALARPAAPAGPTPVLLREGMTRVDAVTKVEPAKVEPAKVEPAKVDGAKVDGAKVEPAKADAAKAGPAK